MNSVMFIQEFDVLKAHLIYMSRITPGHTRHPKEDSVGASGTPKRGARKTTKQQIIVS